MRDRLFTIKIKDMFQTETSGFIILMYDEVNWAKSSSKQKLQDARIKLREASKQSPGIIECILNLNSKQVHIDM